MKVKLNVPDKAKCMSRSIRPKNAVKIAVENWSCQALPKLALSATEKLVYIQLDSVPGHLPGRSLVGK